MPRKQYTANPNWLIDLTEAVTYLPTANRFNPIREVPIRKHPPEKRNL